MDRTDTKYQRRGANWKNVFWSFVSKSDGCWIWTGETNSGGYGKFFMGGRRHFAHRLSWVIANGEIPDDLLVCHDCPGGDNPSCVNPSHLFLGTNSDNQIDSSKKGTHRLKRNPSLQNGEHNPCSKMTTKAVVEIRERYAKGDVTMKELGDDYGVTYSAIHLVLKGVTWKAAGGPIMRGDLRNKSHGLVFSLTTGEIVSRLPKAEAADAP